MGPYWNPELETKPWPEVLRWQEGRVAAMLPALRARSRLYAGKLGATEDVRGLPFTTKDELRQAQDGAAPGTPLGDQQAVPLGSIVQLVSSSGTTGRPVYYGLTAADLGRWSDAIANSFFTAGIRADDVVAHLVALPMVAGGLPYADGLRRIGATLAWLGGFPLERILASLRGLGATALLSTTSFALHLTERGEDVIGAPVSSLGVRKLLGGGEPGLGQPEIRERITRGWRTEHVRETMGLGDVLASMWAACTSTVRPPCTWSSSTRSRSSRSPGPTGRAARRCTRRSSGTRRPWSGSAPPTTCS
jgi:phenylacetate-coenzyme A ligase PaaK-like adenylate-forming protein